MSVPIGGGPPIKLTDEQWDEIFFGGVAGGGGLGAAPSPSPGVPIVANTNPGGGGMINGAPAPMGVQPDPMLYPGTSPTMMGTGAPLGGAPVANPGSMLGGNPLGYDAIANDISPQPRQNTPVVPPFTSSGVPINETLLSQLLYNEPQMAITLGGTAAYGTPGYWNLAGMEFDPYSIFLAQGGNVLNGPTDYLNFASNMYRTMGTIGSEGGGTVNAGALLRNMVLAPAESQLGMMFAEKPELFYQMAVDVATAAGMSPMGQQALKLQLAGLYQEYMTTAVQSNAGDIPAFHLWIASAHPEVVASWGG